MRSDARAEASSDGGAETKQRSGHPDPGTDAPLEFLIAKPLSLVVCGAHVHEHAVAESSHSQRRGHRNAKLNRACHERIADSTTCTKTSEVARAAEQRFVERRCRPAEIFPYGSKREHGSSINAHVPIGIDLGPDGIRRRRKLQPLYG